MTGKTAKSPLAASLTALDQASERLGQALDKCVAEIETAMIACKVPRIGLGSGVPQRFRGAGANVIISKVEIVAGRIAFITKNGETVPLTQIDPETLHQIVSKIRGSQSAPRLGA